MNLIRIPLCDGHKIGLKPDRQYEFFVESDCKACTAWAAYADGSGPNPQKKRGFIMDPDFFDGPAAATPRQIAVLIDEQLGGWPVKAMRLLAFRHKLSEWVIEPDQEPRTCTTAEFEQRRANLQSSYRFVDKDMTLLDGSRTFDINSPSHDWSPKLTRDEYYLMRMSPMFTDALIKQGADQERQRVRRLLD